MDLSKKKPAKLTKFLGHHFEFQVAMDFYTKTSQKSLPPKTLTCPSSHLEKCGVAMSSQYKASNPWQSFRQKYPSPSGHHSSRRAK
jgi:hypothetical protein